MEGRRSIPRLLAEAVATIAGRVEAAKTKPAEMLVVVSDSGDERGPSSCNLSLLPSSAATFFSVNGFDGWSKSTDTLS
jgi:hypothetical protein